MPIFRLSQKLVFPPAELAEDGLLAVGGDLCQDRLLLAYRQGIFPWYSDDEPILWWSPDPRMVLYPNRMYVSRRLLRILRSGRFQFTLDTAFEDVIDVCATIPRRDQEGSWITPEMRDAYVGLHRAGYAHSVECWRDGVLAGGLYGVSLGRCFFGESMFSRERDASKSALYVLCAECQARGVQLIDCQVANPHLFRMGAREIPRSAFLRLLQEELQGESLVGRWSAMSAMDMRPAAKER